MTIKNLIEGVESERQYLLPNIQRGFVWEPKKIENLFGKRPKGVWPSEHCVSPKMLEMFKDLGLEWSISDEGIFFDSKINFKNILIFTFRQAKLCNYK